MKGTHTQLNEAALLDVLDLLVTPGIHHNQFDQTTIDYFFSQCATLLSSFLNPAFLLTSKRLPIADSGAILTEIKNEDIPSFFAHFYCDMLWIEEDDTLRSQLWYKAFYKHLRENVAMLNIPIIITYR